jgi:hypothetical protein
MRSILGRRNDSLLLEGAPSTDVGAGSLPGDGVGNDGRMAKTAAERRTARRRKQQDRDRRRSGAGHSGQERPDRETALRQLIATAMHSDDESQSERIAGELAAIEPAPDDDGLVTHLLASLLGGLWERGWQPADLAHVVRRSATQRVTRLAVAAIAAEARATGAATRSPEEWVGQLAALDALDGSPGPVVTTWRRTEGLSALEAWRDTLRLFSGLTGLGELQQLCPPPSRWGVRRTSPAGRTATGTRTADARTLGRIRALLAKAESTGFPEEAEALSAKAQELMTKYAVDEAVLAAGRGNSLADEVGARRVHLDNPYPEAKLQLLDAVASTNQVRAIYLEPLSIATLVGLPVDLELVELMFTSLLVQATRAMTAAGRAGGRSNRAPSFRRSFLIAYASRIRERLTEGRDHATEEEAASRGAALVPIMQERREAVDDAFERLFPQTYSIQSRSLNARGWYAGRLAAENADLGSGREQVSG